MRWFFCGYHEFRPIVICIKHNGFHNFLDGQKIINDSGWCSSNNINVITLENNLPRFVVDSVTRVDVRRSHNNFKRKVDLKFLGLFTDLSKGEDLV